MTDNIYYDDNGATLVEKESFNNAVLLLTRVKSIYYYIVGFSGKSKVIELAFDFKNKKGDSFTEFITLDFCGDKEQVLLRSGLTAAKATAFEGESFVGAFGVFRKEGDELVYTAAVKKDSVLPLTPSQINDCILKAKDDIIQLVLACEA